MQLRDIHNASTFDQIAALYEDAHKWRSHHDSHLGDVRALSDGQHKRTNIRKREWDDGHGYACRYHTTDVVTWKRSRDDATGANHDSVTVQAYPSLSTKTFADAFTPATLRFDFAHDDGDFVHVRTALSGDIDDYKSRLAATRVYEFKHDHMTFSLDATTGFYMPDVSDCAPMRFIDSQSGSMRTALLKTNYPDFSTWLNAMCSLDQSPESMRLPHKLASAKRACEDVGLLGLLADPDKWEHLRFVPQTHKFEYGRSVLGDRERIKQVLRNAIYKAANVPPTHEVSWMDGQTFATQRRMSSTYNWV